MCCRCTPDPYSGVIGEIHPSYPAGENIVQPVIEDGYGTLMDNRGAIQIVTNLLTRTNCKEGRDN